MHTLGRSSKAYASSGTASCHRLVCAFFWKQSALLQTPTSSCAYYSALAALHGLSLVSGNEAHLLWYWTRSFRCTTVNACILGCSSTAVVHMWAGVEHSVCLHVLCMQRHWASSTRLSTPTAVRSSCTPSCSSTWSVLFVCPPLVFIEPCVSFPCLPLLRSSHNSLMRRTICVQFLSVSNTTTVC